MPQRSKFTRMNFPRTGSPYYYHRLNTNIEAINGVMEEANLTDEQRGILIANVVELVGNAVVDGIDQQIA